MGSTNGIARVFLAVFALASTASAQFLSPEQISSSSSGCANPSIERDVTNNVAFAWDFDDDIYFASSVFASGVDVNVTNGVLNSSKPDLINGFGGQIRISFQRESPQPAATGDDVLTVTNLGGSWGSPVNLTLSDDADQDIRMADSFVGEFAFTWWHTTPTADDEVWLRRGLVNPNELVGPGRKPSVAYDFSQVVHVVFERAGELIHVSHDGIALSAETPLGATTGAENVTLAALEAVHLVYSAAGEVHYMNNELGPFGQSEVLDSGITGAPSLAVGSAGHAAVVYVKNGEVLVRERFLGSFGPAVVVAATTAGADPDADIDTNDYVHVVYEENGAVFYTHNVPAPTPDFTSDVTTGEIFLGVEFTNASTGVYSQILWDFGNGVTTSDENPTYIYEEAGTYTVSLTLSGPGGQVTEAKTNYIVALPPTNIMEVAQVSGFAGETVRHPIISTNTVPMQGYQLAMRYDNAVTPILGVNFDGTISGTAAPEFVAFEANPAGADSFAILGVVLELQKPITGETIPPGTGQLLTTIDYMIPIGTPAGTTSDIWLENGLGIPPINNIFSALVGSDSFSVLPFLLPGSTTVAMPGTTFLRGDATSNGGIDIADAVFVLGYLFSGGTDPVCPDAADAEDSGAIDIADAVYILSYLFADGPVPLYPFPIPGLDPTVDSLNTCM